MWIEVNHQVLRNAAAAASTYCAAQNREMSAADTDIKSMLGSGWTGVDAQAFGGKWEGVDASDSTSTKFYNAVKGFGEALQACADEYQRAQANSYNRAQFLRSEADGL